MSLPSKQWVVRGLLVTVSAGLAACSATADWLNEDPGAGRSASGSQESAYDIISRLGSEESQRPVRKPEPAPEPEPAVVAEKEPAPPPNDEIDISTLDLSGKFPTARKSGQEGYVLSPYGDRKINVKDIPSGSLVADPRFPLGERKYFLVP